LPWKWFDHRTDLPIWLRSGIGQVIAEWAVVERELEEIIQLLLDVEIALSRIVVHSMQVRNRVDVIDLLIEWHVYNDKVPEKDKVLAKVFNKLGERITNKTQWKRDMLAHGLWTKRNGRWFVLRRRARRPTPELLPETKSVARPVLPETVPVSLEMIASVVSEIVTDATELLSFRDRLRAALSPSRYTAPQYSRRRPSPAKKKAPRGRPRSS
jgi:hypothetical protein